MSSPNYRGRHNFVAILLLFCLLFYLPASVNAQKVQVAKNPKSGQIVFSENQAPVLQYNYQAVPLPEGFWEKVEPADKTYAVTRSNYLHPLYGLDGEVLTSDWNKDHPHHRGIYWAWPEVGYQGQKGDLHALQKVFARPTGKISLKQEPTFAQLEAENLWKWEDKTPIVREVTTIRVYPTNKSGRKIDLTLQFTALEETVTLARRDTEHYGGLNIRLKKIRKIKLGEHKDQADQSPQRAWTFASGLWEGSKEPLEITVFEKATNPNYPADFVKYIYLPWFQPTFPEAKTRYELKKGETLTLNYRFWIHRAGASPELYQSQWDAYQKN